jgi:hypothetical protein
MTIVILKYGGVLGAVNFQKKVEDEEGEGEGR